MFITVCDSLDDSPANVKAMTDDVADIISTLESARNILDCGGDIAELDTEMKREIIGFDFENLNIRFVRSGQKLMLEVA